MTTKQTKLIETYIRKEVRRRLTEEKSPRESFKFLLEKFSEEIMRIDMREPRQIKNLIEKYVVYAELHKII